MESPETVARAGRRVWTAVRHAMLSEGVSGEHATAHADIVRIAVEDEFAIEAEARAQAVANAALLREAALAVLDNAETDDNFEGEYLDWLVPEEQIVALRAALAASPADSLAQIQKDAVERYLGSPEFVNALAVEICREKHTGHDGTGCIYGRVDAEALVRVARSLNEGGH